MTLEKFVPSILPKRVFVLAVAAVLLTGSSLASKAITADELAAHLGVQQWKTTVDLPPGSFSVALIEIANGRVGEAIGGGFGADAHDGTGSHLVIMISHPEGALKGTFMLGTASSGGLEGHLPRDISLPEAVALPKKAKAGDYILGGEWKTKNGIIVTTGNIADMKHGILLRITPDGVQSAAVNSH